MQCVHVTMGMTMCASITIATINNIHDIHTTYFHGYSFQLACVSVLQISLSIIRQFGQVILIVNGCSRKVNVHTFIYPVQGDCLNLS